jgi:hypothetical protein
MAELRPLRLLNAVENGTVLGPELDTYLTDPGRLAEFTVLLSQRGHAKRIANGQTTMTAIASSLIATNASFVQATASNDYVVAAVTESALAMSTVSDVPSVLEKVSDNDTAWGYFINSIHYAPNIKKIVAHLSGVDPAIYSTIDLLILDPVSMGDVSVSERGMRALVNYSPAIYTLAGSSVAMALVADNSVAITLVANQSNIIPILTIYPSAMGEIVSRSFATGVMANNAAAIYAIASYTQAWDTFKDGPHFGTYLKSVLANLAGVFPSSYASVNALIDNVAALTAISNSFPAVEALVSSASAMEYLAGSPNIGIILSSTTAMGVIGPDTASMNSFLNSEGAWEGLFASSVAKGYIVDSTTLVDNIAGNSSLLTYLESIAVTQSATGVPDGNASSLQAFPGAPSKVLTLRAKESGIAATSNNYNFGGSKISGSTAGATLSLTSVANRTHVAGYVGLTWNLQGIGITAATLPIVTYVDMS